MLRRIADSVDRIDRATILPQVQWRIGSAVRR
jgi:hypothetical protein